MPRSPLGLDVSVEQYLNAHSPQHPVLEKLEKVTAPLELAMMQISPSQATYLAWLVRLVGARRAIEVGVFTGYSSLTTALALPKDGYLLACDISKEWTDIARTHWQEAGVEAKIDLVLAPALETLRKRIVQGESNSYDFAFIDADKLNYSDYFEACLRLIRRGGVIVLDNMLWGGSLAKKTSQTASSVALRNLNERLVQDARVDCSLIPVGDGLMLLTKR